MATSYEVIMRCVVKKSVVCEGCTEEQARDNPWDYAIEESELDQEEWTVLRVLKD